MTLKVPLKVKSKSPAVTPVILHRCRDEGGDPILFDDPVYVNVKVS